jgi:cytochrome c1
LGRSFSTRLADIASIFYHKDGLPPVGLWVMPDNQREGMMEGNYLPYRSCGILIS